MPSDSDIALDIAILETLEEIKAILAELSERNATAASSAQALSGVAVILSEKMGLLAEVLGQQKEYTVDVTAEGSDGAINDLVSRVVEEIIIRVKQENYLTITEG